MQSRSVAREAVLEGRVLVSGSVASKPERMVDPAEAIELVGPGRRFVSRGGEKLDGALAAFGIDVSGKRCLDVGSSTGGFADRLLQGGAASVIALDVGRDQLAWSIRTDERVTVMERTDVRDIEVGVVGILDLVVVDVSFISLRTVLPAITRLAGAAPIVALCKPQFEVGKGRVGRKGVVTDPELHTEAVQGVVSLAESLGWRCVARVASSITGAEGNQEFFLHLEPA